MGLESIFKKKEVKKEFCKYCGKEVGTHTDFCVGMYDFEKPKNREKENKVFDIVRESGDIVREYYGVHDEDYTAHLINKVEILDKKGHKIDLSNYLPEGCKIIKFFPIGLQKEQEIKNPTFLFNSNDKKLGYATLYKKGMLLSFLHELGHAIDIVKNKKGKPSNTPSTEYLQSRPVVARMFLKSIARDEVDEERVAWAFALKIIRDLKKQGIDLEPGVNIDEYIKECLSSHGSTLEAVAEKELSQEARRRFKMDDAI